MKSKNVYIIAGPNGAGKTTFACEFLPWYAKCPHFVNADLIAEKIKGSLKVLDSMLFEKIVGESRLHL